jgi:hypothetical protein
MRLSSLTSSREPDYYFRRRRVSDMKTNMRMLCSTMLVALTLICWPMRAFPHANTSQDQKTSQTDKAKKCDETAKNRGLKGDEKATFVSSCMAAKDTASATASPEEQQKADKAKSCEQQADQQSLKGKDRRSFLKTCAGK